MTITVDVKEKLSWRNFHFVQDSNLQHHKSNALPIELIRKASFYYFMYMYIITSTKMLVYALQCSGEPLSEDRAIVLIIPCLQFLQKSAVYFYKLLMYWNYTELYGCT